MHRASLQDLTEHARNPLAKMWGKGILVTESMTSPRPRSSEPPTPILRSYGTVIRSGPTSFVPLCVYHFFLFRILCLRACFARIYGSHLQMVFSYYPRARVVAHVAL